MIPKTLVNITPSTASNLRNLGACGPGSVISITSISGGGTARIVTKNVPDAADGTATEAGTPWRLGWVSAPATDVIMGAQQAVYLEVSGSGATASASATVIGG